VDSRAFASSSGFTRLPSGSRVFSSTDCGILQSPVVTAFAGVLGFLFIAWLQPTETNVMRCPDCGHNNVDGSDECQACGISLSNFDAQGTDIEQSIAAHPINVLCTREPICVTPETPVRKVVQQMAAKNLGCVLVENSQRRLLGVFSERDVLNKIAGDQSRLDRPVSDFMTVSPGTVTKRDSIGFALQTMDLGGFRHLPIVDSEHLPVGLLSARDILRFLGVKYAQSRS
jgi:CBS domain-containing protein